MDLALLHDRRFLFAQRPTPVPGDLRIGWRLAITLLMLSEARAKRASLAKLHVLNYATRSLRAREQLARILEGVEPPLNWQMRVEPAFGRALDFIIGEKFAIWLRVAGRTGLELTDSGLKAASVIAGDSEVLTDEKGFLAGLGKKTTEQFVSKLLNAGRSV